MQSGIRLSPALFKEIGLHLVEWGDGAFLLGVVNTAQKIVKTLKAARLDSPPLDWTHPFQDTYFGEPQILRLYDSGSRTHIYLPQVLLLGMEEEIDESSIRVKLLDRAFNTKVGSAPGLEFYRQNAEQNGRRFFDGENARLVDWDSESRVLTFQGCSYMEYLSTNLSLDSPRALYKSLRQELVYDGRLEPLPESALANTTGVNGLVFTTDGYLIYQRRREDVLLRSGELCSGFSGTIDWIDVKHAVASGGTLTVMDTPRELVEELGVRWSEISNRTFLGITRELIRGGAPEMFYSIDLSITAREVFSRTPQDREGTILGLEMGGLGTTHLGGRDREKLPRYFPDILLQLRNLGSADVSVPLLTNLVLWLHHNSPTSVTVGSLPRR